MTYSVEYLNKVVKKDIPQLSEAAKKQIKKAIEEKLTTDPIHFGKPLRYGFYGQRSLRVGNYRVLYIVDVEVKLVTIVAIAHRKEVYN